MKTLDELQAEVSAWAKGAFPNSNLSTITDHLAEEMIELIGSSRVQRALQRMPYCEPADYPAREIADCLLLMLHLSTRLGFTLLEAAELKFTEVQTRQWDSGSERGYSKHVPTEAKGE